MGFLVVNGAQMQCSFGAAPANLIVIPTSKVMATTPAGNIMDYKPMANILPFGMCQSMANPQVAAATSAAMGVLTPQPCIPNVVAPWVPGCPTVLIANQPALNNASKATCLWGGIIQIINPGQTSVMIP